MRLLLFGQSFQSPNEDEKSLEKKRIEREKNSEKSKKASRNKQEKIQKRAKKNQEKMEFIERKKRNLNLVEKCKIKLKKRRFVRWVCVINHRMTCQYTKLVTNKASEITNRARCGCFAKASKKMRSRRIGIYRANVLNLVSVYTFSLSHSFTLTSSFSLFTSFLFALHLIRVVFALAILKRYIAKLSQLNISMNTQFNENSRLLFRAFDPCASLAFSVLSTSFSTFSLFLSFSLSNSFLSFYLPLFHLSVLTSLHVAPTKKKNAHFFPYL